ncbi:MAG: rRNA pseudouridine synthase [Oscillospiraceae bacterium]|nr:rRNA pseudouridine synthase [Oscillospiraceae bacterium]
MLQRLQKCIAEAGVASRRAAEQMISDGRVTVNGAPAVLGQSADPERDEIRVDGRLLPKREKNVYILLHKPRGYVTTLRDEQGRRTVADLVRGVPVRVYPVGRLDLDSEGLLLMTNDGDLAHAVMHPSHAVDKVYHVAVSGAPIAAAAEAMRAMTDLDGEPIAPPGVRVIGEDRLAVTIHEGKNREVRRLCAAAGLTVHRLIRVQEGSLKLGNLKRGTWRYLTDAELRALKEEADF